MILAKPPSDKRKEQDKVAFPWVSAAMVTAAFDLDGSELDLGNLATLTTFKLKTKIKNTWSE